MKAYKSVFIVLIASLIAAAIAYPFLPDQIPIHWDIDGTVRTSSKLFIFLIALLPAVIYYSIKRKYSK